MKNKILLEEEIQTLLGKLSKTEPGTEDYKNIVDNITRLMDRQIEIEKVINDKYDKEDIRHIEYKIKSAELEMEKKDRLFKNILTAVSIGSGFIITIGGAWATFKFEETGTITSSIGKKVINRFFPSK